MKRRYLLLFLPLVLFLFFCPAESLRASCDGVSLWFHTVLPTLLPFIILSNLLLRSGTVLPLLSRLDPLWNRLLGLSSGGAYCLILGLFCGFPMGARLTAGLLRDGHLSEDEASYLLCFCNNASPMFLSGFLVTGSLRSPELMLPVLLTYYAGVAITLTLCRVRFRRFHIRSGKASKKEETVRRLSVGELMDVSIMDAFDAITRLGGYIILFSICSAMLVKLCAYAPGLHPAAAMLLEITTGTGAVLSSSWSASLKLAVLLGGTAFGGLSVLAQTAGMIRGSGLRLGSYFCSKVLQGGLTFLLVLVWLFLFV